MRHLITLLFVATFALTGCVVEEAECPEQEDVACSCDDGSQGVLECEDGTASCICEAENDGGDDQEEEEEEDEEQN